MFKRIFFHALIAGILAAIAGVIYYRIYFFATAADFSRVLNTATIFGFSLIVCLLGAFLYWALVKWLRQRGEVVFNFIFSIISFVCVIIPISLTLPLDIRFPELFPGLAVPMVFFPAMAWYTVRPLFRYKS